MLDKKAQVILATATVLAAGTGEAQQRPESRNKKAPRTAEQVQKVIPTLPKWFPEVGPGTFQELRDTTPLEVYMAKGDSIFREDDTTQKIHYLYVLYRRIQLEASTRGITQNIQDVAFKTSRNLTYIRHTSLTPIERKQLAVLGLAFATLLKNNDVSSTISHVSSILRSNMRSPRIAELENLLDSPELRPILEQLVRRYVDESRKTGGENDPLGGARGDMYRMLTEGFVNKHLLSASLVEILLNNHAKTGGVREIERRLASNKGPDRASLLRFDFWKSVPSAEKSKFLQMILSNGGDFARIARTPQERAALQEQILIDRHRWMDTITLSDWLQALEAGLNASTMGPNRMLELVTHMSERGRIGTSKIHDSEIPFVRKVFLHPEITSTMRVYFLQNASFDSYSAMDQFKKELLEISPVELLVLQNRNPRILPVNSIAVSWGADTIFHDEALRHIKDVRTEFLPEEIRKLDPVEIAHWKARVARNHFFDGTPITSASVLSMTERIKEQQERLRNINPFKAAHVVVVANGELRRKQEGVQEPRFGKRMLIEGIMDPQRGSAATYEIISPLEGHETGNHRITATSREAAFRRTLDAITQTKAPMTLFFDAHGGTKERGQSGNIYLTDGQVENIVTEPSQPRQVVETKDTTKISAEQIAEAFLTRYGGSNPEANASLINGTEWVIFGTCVSPNVGRRIAEIMSEKGIAPPGMIFMSEFGQFGYSHFFLDTGSDFAERTLGLGRIQSQNTGAWPVTINGIRQRSGSQLDSRPGILVPEVSGGRLAPPGSRGKARYLQISGTESIDRSFT